MVKLEKLLFDKRYGVEHGIYAEETNLSVDSWFDTWMEEYKKNSAANIQAAFYDKALSLGKIWIQSL